MGSLIVSFFSGYIISLSGSLAPSNMSATAMGLTIDKNKKAGLLFGLGSSLVEIIYIRLYFLGFDTFIRKTHLFLILQWVMIVLFLVLGIIMFIRTYKRKDGKKRQKKDFSHYSYAKSFFMGIVLKAINPLQFIFWTFWSAYLIANDWLQPTSTHYNLFCIGLGAATFTGFLLYVYLGSYLETKSFFSKTIFRRVIAVFLSLTSVAWALKLLIKPEGTVM
jgi:threonine/homoserine/homoserine lactone efflux protein